MKNQGTQDNPEPNDPETAKIDRLVGQKIRDARLLMGLTIPEFAELLKQDTNFLSLVEDGVVRVSPDALMTIAAITQQTISYFFTFPSTK